MSKFLSLVQSGRAGRQAGVSMAYINIVCSVGGRFVLITMRQVSALPWPHGTSWRAVGELKGDPRCSIRTRNVLEGI